MEQLETRLRSIWSGAVGSDFSGDATMPASRYGHLTWPLALQAKHLSFMVFYDLKFYVSIQSNLQIFSFVIYYIAYRYRIPGKIAEAG